MQEKFNKELEDLWWERDWFEKDLKNLQEKYDDEKNLLEKQVKDLQDKNRS